MSNDPFFTVTESTSSEGEKPPEISQSQYGYTSYFENEHGDQLVFLYDREAGEAHVYNGRSGWGEKSSIGRQQLLDGDFHVHYEQKPEEKRWLFACLQALQPQLEMEWDRTG